MIELLLYNHHSSCFKERGDKRQRVKSGRLDQVGGADLGYYADNSSNGEENMNLTYGLGEK